MVRTTRREALATQFVAISRLYVVSEFWVLPKMALLLGSIIFYYGGTIAKLAPFRLDLKDLNLKDYIPKGWRQQNARRLG